MPSYDTGKYVCKLSPELQKKAKDELKEDPARREEDIEILRQWITKQPYINGRTDDAFLLKFLRNAKFSIERAKEKIENYYTMKTAIPEWFSNHDLNHPKLQKLLSKGMFLPLGYDKEGRFVVLGRTAAYDPSEFKVEDVMKLNFIVSEYLLWDEQTQICGSVFINDGEGATGGHLAQWTPAVMKKAMTCFQDCLPIRSKGMHYVNLPSFFETFFNVMKMFMKEKLIRRLYVHGNLESLQQQVPIDILPKEYGGLAGDCDSIAAKFTKDLNAHRQFFIDDEKYKVDESKRPGKPKTPDDIFGHDGTFRKLNID
ncbi:hypothetical protein CHUAL_009875 [Chamberlinius hualienensis]